MICDLTPMDVDETTGNAHRVCVKRYTYTDSTHFAIRRFQGADIANLAFADGSFVVAVYG